jgi:hypothetical protein
MGTPCASYGGHRAAPRRVGGDSHGVPYRVQTISNLARGAGILLVRGCRQSRERGRYSERTSEVRRGRSCPVLAVLRGRPAGRCRAVRKVRACQGLLQCNASVGANTATAAGVYATLQAPCAGSDAQTRLHSRLRRRGRRHLRAIHVGRPPCVLAMGYCTMQCLYWPKSPQLQVFVPRLQPNCGGLTRKHVFILSESWLERHGHDASCWTSGEVSPRACSPRQYNVCTGPNHHNCKYSCHDCSLIAVG